MIGYQFLIEVDVEDAAGVEETLRYCCAPQYTGGVYTWEPRIIDPGLFSVSLFTGGKTTGPSRCSYGEVVLGNFMPFETGVGPIDSLKTKKFYGRAIRMWYGLPSAVFPGQFTKAYEAIVDTPVFSWNSVTLPIKGKQADLDTPLDTGKFLGTNTLPLGIEGGTELKDRIKPFLLGRAFNFSPILCNSAKLIYAASPLSGLSVDELNSNIKVYDNGVELSFKGIKADLENFAPPAASFYASAAGYIRLGSTPAGAVTMTAASKGLALTSKPANLIEKLLTLQGKEVYINAASFTDHNVNDGWERGIFLSSAMNISTIFDNLLAPLGYWYFDHDGKIILGQLQDPQYMIPSLSLFGDTNIKSFTIKKSLDTKGGAPASKVTVRYAKNYTVSANPAASVSVERKLKLSEAWSQSTVDAPPENIQPISEEMIIDSLCTNENTSHNYLLSQFYCYERSLIEVEVTQEMFLACAVLLPGICISIDLKGRFGYNDTPMLLIGTTINYVEESVRFTLWG